MTSLPKDSPAKESSGHLHEFSIIREIFAPLSKSAPGAFGLQDDAACLAPKPGHDLVLTKDTLVSGVHFLSDDPADLIAKKSLRVNLSDLAAKGAVPVGYLLSCAWPETTTAEFIRRFADGLQDDQDKYGFSLLGGDTVRTPGPLTVTVTAIGEVPAGQMLRRSGAKSGDDLYLTGTIGDASLGLQVLQSNLDVASVDDKAALVRRYHLPDPRVTLGPKLLGIAHGSIDVSDGLFADARHVAEVSGVRIVLEAEHIPLSAAARAIEADPIALGSGGDDYEILFTAGADASDLTAALSKDLNIEIHRVGRVETGEGLCVLDETGAELDIGEYGYEHKPGTD